MMNATKVLSLNEIQMVLADLESRSRRSMRSWQNLIIFRLSCCCGLRRKEISGLTIADVQAFGDRPVVHVRKEITKGRLDKRRPRQVPLWWDAGTLHDLADWREYRLQQTSDPQDPFICSEAAGHGRLTTSSIARRWKTAIRILGPERVKQLSIHSGRHSFCSHALRAGRSLIEVRDAAGHANVTMTSEYLHVIDADNVPDIFGR